MTTLSELTGFDPIILIALAVTVCLIILVVIIRLCTRGKKKDRLYTDRELDKAPLPNEYPYRRRNLLTRPEYVFYQILKEKAETTGLTVFAKVRLEDIVEVHDTKEINRYRGYIKSRHIDFVLCDKNISILTAIELDDSSHKKNKRNDTLKDNVLKAAGIPLERVKVGTSYNKAVDDIIERAKEDSK